MKSEVDERERPVLKVRTIKARFIPTITTAAVADPSGGMASILLTQRVPDATTTVVVCASECFPDHWLAEMARP